jgi:hypothetical protein
MTKHSPKSSSTTRERKKAFRRDTHEREDVKNSLTKTKELIKRRRTNGEKLNLTDLECITLTEHGEKMLEKQKCRLEKRNE